jgi:hypothetical protein
VGAALPTPPSSRPVLISRGLGARKREQGDSAFAPIETPDVSTRKRGGAQDRPSYCGGSNRRDPSDLPGAAPAPTHLFQFALNAD